MGGLLNCSCSVLYAHPCFASVRTAATERHLREQNRPRPALCGIELRSPAPFTFEGFARFNDGYRALLDEWGILVDGDNPIPRTNVAPVAAAPAEPSLYAFDYTVPGTTPAPTFVVAGAGEMGDRARGADGIVRRGETSPDAMREKARFVMGIRQERMRALGAEWARVTTIDVYTAQPIHGFLVDEILGPAGPAAIHGVRWFPSRPRSRASSSRSTCAASSASWSCRRGDGYAVASSR
jgi:hypothetical protein